MTRASLARPQRKPKVTDRLNAWALAYDSIRQLSAKQISHDGAAIAAAILAVGSFDLDDKALNLAATVIGWNNTAQGEPNGDE